jgi:hypothetical protein
MPDVSVQDSFEGRYTLPIVETVQDSAEEIRQKQERVRELCAERNAILLAHHYQRPEVQEVADAVADSLKLSQAARFCCRRRSSYCRTCAPDVRWRLRSHPRNS